MKSTSPFWQPTRLFDQLRKFVTPHHYSCETGNVNSIYCNFWIDRLMKWGQSVTQGLCGQMRSWHLDHAGRRPAGVQLHT